MISNQLLRFFQVNNADLTSKQSITQIYRPLHQRLLHKAKMKNALTDLTTEHLVQHPTILQEKSWDMSIIYPQYTFENGPRTRLTREFFNWWGKHYQYPGSPVKIVKIHLQPKTHRSLANLLIHKKSSRAMLTRIEPTLHRKI